MEDQLAYKLCQPLAMPILRNTISQVAITKVCSEISCERRPLITGPEDTIIHNDHAGKVIEVESFVTQFSDEMSRLASQNIRLYQEFTQPRENVQLLELLEQGEPHLRKLEDLIIRQKTEIATDVTLLQEKISLIIQQIKEENMRRLDTFLDQYKKAFSSLKQSVDSFFLLSRKNFYYSNQNTLQMKLASLPTLEAQTLIQTLKSHLNLSKSLQSSTPLQVLTDLQGMSRFLIQMTNAPPNYDRIHLVLDQVVKEVGQVLNNLISTRLFVPVGNNKDVSQVGTGDNNLQIQLDTKNAEKFILKPTKKFTVDTQISCVLCLTDSLFAMGSLVDQSLRIFDTSQRNVATYSGHGSNIIFLEKLTTQDLNSRAFVSLSADKLAIVWNIDDMSVSTVSRSLKIFKKIQLQGIPMYALDMKDATHFAFCEQSRDISICNWYTQKLGTNTTKHLQKINGLTLVKKGERFLSYSSDSLINIWKIVKQGASPILICDQTLHDPLYGSISHVFVTTQWLNQAIIISNEGCIKIFDFNKNCIVFSKFGTRKINSTFLECVLLEESEKKINPPLWIIAVSFNEAIAQQYHLTTGPYAMHAMDMKLEHPIVLQQNGKHKVQMYQLQQNATSGSGKSGNINLMFIGGESNQELLVYDVRSK